MAHNRGIHHISAICGPPQENIDFYTGVLGLRLVKLTVNYDDPSAYHFYYGDQLGSPGTLLTFFPYPAGHPGRPGTGQATMISLGIPEGAIPFWADRFKRREVDFDKPNSQDGMDCIRFRAPDGLQLELVESSLNSAPAPIVDGLPLNRAIVGIESVTLTEKSAEATQEVLENLLGYRIVIDRPEYIEFVLPSGGLGSRLKVHVDPEGPANRQGRGAVHHIAFREANETSQIADRVQVVNSGLHASPIQDRSYFKSVYFREPGGVLFELATDGPGFAVDEPEEQLGTSLMLPERLEEYRTQILRALDELRLPKGIR